MLEKGVKYEKFCAKMLVNCKNLIPGKTYHKIANIKCNKMEIFFKLLPDDQPSAKVTEAQFSVQF